MTDTTSESAWGGNEGSTYKATINFARNPATIRAECADCDWTGTADQLRRIRDCSLTPGDSSPAGRCPECGTLAYAIEPSLYYVRAVDDNGEDQDLLVWANGKDEVEPFWRAHFQLDPDILPLYMAEVPLTRQPGPIQWDSLKRFYDRTDN